MDNFQKEKDQLVTICRILSEKSFVAATDGNVSVRLPDNRVLITPSGINKRFVESNQLIITDMEGELIAGETKPSSEIQMHLAVYRKRQDIHAVVHAHPPYCVAFSIAGISLETPYLPEVVLTLGKIPTAKYATPTTKDVAESIKELIDEYDAIILERHGTVTLGKDIYQAYNYLEKIEHSAFVYYLALQMGSPAEIPAKEIKKLKQVAVALGLKEPKIGNV